MGSVTEIFADSPFLQPLYAEEHRRERSLAVARGRYENHPRVIARRWVVEYNPTPNEELRAHRSYRKVSRELERAKTHHRAAMDALTFDVEC